MNPDPFLPQIILLALLMLGGGVFVARRIAGRIIEMEWRGGSVLIALVLLPLVFFGGTLLLGMSSMMMVLLGPPIFLGPLATIALVAAFFLAVALAKRPLESLCERPGAPKVIYSLLIAGTAKLLLWGIAGVAALALRRDWAACRREGFSSWASILRFVLMGQLVVLLSIMLFLLFGVSLTPFLKPMAGSIFALLTTLYLLLTAFGVILALRTITLRPALSVRSAIFGAIALVWLALPAFS